MSYPRTEYAAPYGYGYPPAATYRAPEYAMPTPADMFLQRYLQKTRSRLMGWGFGGTAVGIGLVVTGAVASLINPVLGAGMMYTGLMLTTLLPFGITGAIMPNPRKIR